MPHSDSARPDRFVYIDAGVVVKMVLGATARLGGKGAMVNCPLCDAVIDVDEDELDEGDSLICEECGSNLNVGGTNPLELNPEVDSDEDEEEELDDEEVDDEDDDEDDEEEDEDEWE